MKRQRILVALGALVLLGVTVAGIGLIWWQRQVDPPGDPGRPTEITVRPGMSTASIGELLEERGVISNASVFRWYTQLKGLDSIQAGDYSLRRRDDMGRVVAVLKQGSKVQLDRLTVPEGLTLPEVAELVGKVPGRSAHRFLAAARSRQVTSPFQAAGARDLEGLLAP